MQSYLEWISNVPNLFIPGAKLTTRKTQETSKCSHYIPIISWFYPHHAYHPTIFVGYIPIVHGSMTNPTLPLHRRLGPNGGGGLPLVLYSKRKFSLVFSSERESAMAARC